MSRKESSQEFLNRMMSDGLTPEQRRQQHAEQREMLGKDEAPIIAAIEEAGWPEGVLQGREEPVLVNGQLSLTCWDPSRRSVWDFANSNASYPHLLEIMADHIVKPYHYRTREGLARALMVKESRGTRIPRVLLEELKELNNPADTHAKNYRWALINTLVLIGDSSMSEEVRTLLNDSRFAEVKKDLQRLAKALNRSSKSGEAGG
jgi:hypothetical protein